MASRNVTGGEERPPSSVQRSRVLKPSRARTVAGTCLQDAVLRCCPVASRQRLRTRLAVACQSGHGSGLAGSFADACNFASVGIGLLSEGLAVWVVGRAHGVQRGWMRWALGDPDGRNVGEVLWLEAQRHVVRLVGADVVLFVSQMPDGVPEEAPWWTSVVGAPKKGKKVYSGNRLAGLKSFASAMGSTDDNGDSAAGDGLASNARETVCAISAEEGRVVPCASRPVTRARAAKAKAMGEGCAVQGGACLRSRVGGLPT